MIRPGDTFAGTFAVSNPTTSALSEADATPVVSVSKNGVVDGTVTATISHISTGKYSYSFAVPSGYVSGDRIEVWAAATVDDTAGGNVVGRDTVDTTFIGAVATGITDIKGTGFAKDTNSLVNLVKSGDTVDLTSDSVDAIVDAVAGAKMDFVDAPNTTALAALANAVISKNIGSTAASLTLKKALEVVFAALVGRSNFNQGTGTWDVYAADNTTIIAHLVLTDEGDRNAPVIR